MDPIYYSYVLLAIQEPIRRSLRVRNWPHFFDLAWRANRRDDFISRLSPATNTLRGSTDFAILRSPSRRDGEWERNREGTAREEHRCGY